MEKRVKREKREKEYISIAEASEILGSPTTMCGTP